MIDISPLPSMAALEQLWRHIGGNSSHSFFLSWQWTSTWLRCIQPHANPLLLTVTLRDIPVAAAIVVNRTLWRRALIPINTWILNATGDADMDSICIEYNGLLASDQHMHDAWTQVLDHFHTSDTDWDEIRLGAVPPWLADAWTAKGLPTRQVKRDICRFIDLDAVRASPSRSCLDTLAPRARTSLRHTIAAITKRHGVITLEEATTRQDAQLFLNELKILHMRRWSDKSAAGTFNLPFFERFHRELIDCHFDSGIIQLVRARAGGTTVGLLYNFVYQGRVLFYQSGIDYAVAQHGESPGLLLHALVINRNAQLGHSIYDMLAVDSQYKRTLAKLTTELWWGELQAPRAKLRAEKLAVVGYRTIRKKVRKLLVR